MIIVLGILVGWSQYTDGRSVTLPIFIIDLPFYILNDTVIESTWGGVKAFLKGWLIACLLRRAGKRKLTHSQSSFTSLLQSTGANIQPLQNRSSFATRLLCVSNHRRRCMHAATTHTVSRFGRLAQHSGTAPAPLSADCDIVPLFVINELDAQNCVLQ